jgi:hypothetical protein
MGPMAEVLAPDIYRAHWGNQVSNGKDAFHILFYLKSDNFDHCEDDPQFLMFSYQVINSFVRREHIMGLSLS